MMVEVVPLVLMVLISEFKDRRGPINIGTGTSSRSLEFVTKLEFQLKVVILFGLMGRLHAGPKMTFRYFDIHLRTFLKKAKELKRMMDISGKLRSVCCVRKQFNL